jgi:DNA invertase Pin-like site-specific DNA recombinase
VSTSEQADSRAGLEAQRAAILAEAARRGWAEVEFVEDAGFSAGSLRRPGLAHALNRLRAGEASVLMVSKMESPVTQFARFCRNNAASAAGGMGVGGVGLAR